MVVKLAFLQDLPKSDSEAGSFGNEDKDTRLLKPVTLFLLGLRKMESDTDFLNLILREGSPHRWQSLYVTSTELDNKNSSDCLYMIDRW